jgi:hypothetical protein
MHSLGVLQHLAPGKWGIATRQQKSLCAPIKTERKMSMRRKVYVKEKCFYIVF